MDNHQTLDRALPAGERSQAGVSQQNLDTRFTCVAKGRWELVGGYDGVPAFAVRVRARWPQVWELQNRNGDRLVNDGFESLGHISGFLRTP